MTLNVAIDTNILGYAEGFDDLDRQGTANDLIDRLLPECTYIPLQVLGEFQRILVRKKRAGPREAGIVTLRWRNTFQTIETTDEIFVSAVDLAATHGLQIWDAIILSAAAAAGCRLLLSEDFHDGFAWHGVTVVNPFAIQPSPLLERVLGPR